MAFRYASYEIPQASPSSLASFLPAFEAGQQKRNDELAGDALSRLLSGQASGPYQQPAPATSSAPANPAAPAPAAAPAMASGPVNGTRSVRNNNPGNIEASSWTQQQPGYVGTDGRFAIFDTPEHGQAAMTSLLGNYVDNGHNTISSIIGKWSPSTDGNPVPAYVNYVAARSRLAPDAPVTADQIPTIAAAMAQFEGGPQAGNYFFSQHPATVGDAAAEARAALGEESPAPATAPVPAQLAQPQLSAPTGQIFGPNGLPDRDTMMALFRSPSTRPLAIQLAQAAQAANTPQGRLDLQLKQAEVAKTLQEVNGGAIPAGYRRAADGNLQAIPGGPDDPNNPLNAMKTGSFGAAMSGNAQVGVSDATGQPDPQQQQRFLASLPQGTAALVKGIADYQLDPNKVTSLRGNQRQQMIQLVQQYDPTFDMSQYPARAAMRKSITSGTYSQVLNSANLVINHLAALWQASNDLNNQNFTPLNALVNAGKNVTGDPTITNFNVTAKAAGDELAKVFKGSGASDVGSIEAWEKNLDANSSPAQQQQAIMTAMGLLKSRLDTIESQYQQTMGRPADFTFLKPDAVAALQKLGIDPSTLTPGSKPSDGDSSSAGPVQIKGDDDYNALPSGTQFIGPDGQTRVKP